MRLITFALVIFITILLINLQTGKTLDEPYKIGITCNELYNEVPEGKIKRMNTKGMFLLKDLQVAVKKGIISKVECNGVEVKLPLSNKILQVISDAVYYKGFYPSPMDGSAPLYKPIIATLWDNGRNKIGKLIFSIDCIFIDYEEEGKCNVRMNSINYRFRYHTNNYQELLKELNEAYRIRIENAIF